MKSCILLLIAFITLNCKAQVTSVFESPLAGDDKATIQPNTDAKINILANDKDIQGNLATLDNVRLPELLSVSKNGSPAINLRGELIYTPKSDFTGTDTLTYRICDPDNAVLCDTATVVLIIGKAVESPLYEWLEKYVSIRRSLEDANLQSKPAELGFFEPLSGNNSQGDKGYFQLNGILGLDLSAINLFNLQKSKNTLASVSISYNRNSGLKEPQNSLATGLTVLKIKNYGEWSGAGIYRRDYQKESRSAHVVLQLSPIWEGHYRPFNMNMTGPNIYDPETAYKRLKFYYGFTIGLENEYRFEVDTENADEEGHYARPLLKAGIRVNPWYVNDRISLFSNYHWRYDLIKPDTYDGSRSHPLFEAGIDFGVIDRDVTSAIVGLSYKNGDNPIEGLQKNEFWAIVLKVKL